MPLRIYALLLSIASILPAMALPIFHHSMSKSVPLELFSPRSAPSPAGNTSVNNSFGEVQGWQLPSGVRAFLGIPFGGIPVRFSYPVLWQRKYEGGVWNATVFGPQCAQKGLVVDGTNSSEDCLYLNIWTPPSTSLSSSPTSASASASASSASAKRRFVR